MQALALVMYTWVENVAIYLFETGIWQILFICTFVFDCFSKFYTFHDAWAHTASMSIFPTYACLLKPVGIDVQTSNIHTRKCFVFTNIFTIHGYYFRVLYFDFAWFMWKRVEYVGWPIAEHTWHLADACRLKPIWIQAQNQSCKNWTFLYANLSFDCFSNVCNFQDTFESSQDVSADSKFVDTVFPTDAFLLKLVGIDVLQAEVTRQHVFKRIFAILGGSLQIFLFILFVNVL